MNKFIVVCTIIWLAAMAGVIYIAVHFLSKFW